MGDMTKEFKAHTELTNNLKIDVWATTCKFTVLGSNSYDASLPKLKQLIKGTL